MKVICIDTSMHRVHCIEKLIEGNVYEVIGEMAFPTGVGYKIKGYEFAADGRGAWYAREGFVPLSEIDETEMERNYNLQSV